MNTEIWLKNNRRFYQYGMITFIESVRYICDLQKDGYIDSERAEKEIKALTRIKIHNT